MANTLHSELYPWQETISHTASIFAILGNFLLPFSVSQDKEIYRWPIKESIKAMLAWEWTLEKARDGEGEVEKKAVTRKISQTAQV